MKRFLFVVVLLLAAGSVAGFGLGSKMLKKTNISRLSRLTATTNQPAAPTTNLSRKKKSTTRTPPSAVRKPSLSRASKSSATTDTLAEIMRMVKALDERMGNPLTDSTSEKNQSDLLNGVVRVYCTHSPPNFSMPWQRLKQEFSTSTGFVIGRKRLLTNAHAVEFGSLIQVKRRESEDKYVASVLAVGHECDLAILTVEDEKFWRGINPLTLGEVPDLQEEVSVIGYPVGGDSISISSGVVSRVEMQEYAQASAQLLAIQIDAAINPGNSGGPVVNTDGEVIGVAFQSLSQEDIENIGYVVPSSVIKHFLGDVEKHGSYSGVSSLGVRMQGMENEVLRRHYGMLANDTGALVLLTAPLSPAASVLEKNDVMLAVDGIRIANDCTIPFRSGGSYNERVQVNYHFTQRFAGEKVRLDVLRNKKRITVEVPLCVSSRVIPRTLTQKNVVNTATNQGTGSKGSIVGGVPSYLIIGGLVMMALSQEYLAAEFEVEHMRDFESWTEEYRLLSLADAPQQEKGEEVVVLSQVIAHTCNIGYESIRNMHLKKFNGEVVKNLKQLKTLIDDTYRRGMGKRGGAKKLAPLVFEFHTGIVVVLEAAAALAAQTQISQEHGIPVSSVDERDGFYSLCSDDFR